MRFVRPLPRATRILIAMTGISCGARQPIMTSARLDTTHVVSLPTMTMASPMPVSDARDLFARLDRADWPPASQLRTAAGTPGPAYWQQRADYTIEATLDTGDAAIQGKVTIRYTNNSPDTLRFLWLQLDQNLYRPMSKGSRVYPSDSRWGVRGFAGGYEITSLQANNRPVGGQVDDTMMRIDLDEPVAPRGGTSTLSMSFTFRVPEHGSDRMGRDSTLFQIAQWFPRMAVYDDVRGWNTDPYLGQGEFYLEYGNIDYAITVPAGYVVAGSGALQNAGDVLSPAQRQRLEEGSKASTVVNVITETEAHAAKTRTVSGTKTWRFRAENVRDVAWAAAPDFRWDATSWNGVLTQAFYQFPKAGKAWEHAAEQTQWSIRNYSTMWFPYPYPQATSVAGPVGGMEYPMFVMVHYGTDDPASIFSTIDHEHGHEWFPMIVGSNERLYAWQDEGMNTYINAFSTERRSPGTTAFPAALASWKNAVAAETQSPLMTHPDRIEPSALGAIGYRKPAAVLLALRNNVIGKSTMDRALREYARRWAFKHPTPADFFRTIESVSGEDLSWFWRAFFYETDVLDFALEGVSMRDDAGQRVADIVVRRMTSVPFPIVVRLRLADGSNLDARAPVQVWNNTVRYTLTVPVAGTVVGARLWPDPTVPDWNDANNLWGSPPPPIGDPPTSGGLVPSITRPPG